MASNLGQFSPILSQAASLVAVVGALVLTFKKRAPWEPVQEDVPQGPQRVAGLLVAVIIGGLWWYQGASQTDVRPLLVSIAVGCAVATVFAVLVYSLLITTFTYERVIATGPRTTKKEKVIGGFHLTSDAAARRREDKVTIQELFKGAAYDADKVWTRFSRGAAKASFSLAYMMLIGCGTVALGAISMALVPVEQQALGPAVEKWIVQAEQAKAARTIHAGAPLPTSLVAARTEFEQAWTNTGLPERRRLDPKRMSTALSYMTGVYRVQEQNESTKTNATHWADEAIRFFEETQKPDLLLEALLDKAAVLLDMSQQENTSKEAFLRISRDGDAVMTRAAALADQEKKPEKKAEVLRISSRFYYALARPGSFRLSEPWDNNYLLLAHKRAEEAVAAAPKEIRNTNQLLRATMKAAKNPPQDGDPKWAAKLRETQRSMKAKWVEVGPGVIAPAARVSPLSVLGTGTLEAVAREWHDLPPAKRRAAAVPLAEELENDSLVPLREAEALLKNGELKNSYGFDIYYDLSRAYAQRVAMLRLSNPVRAASEFGEVKANFCRARENAKTSQMDSVALDIDRDLSFSQLAASEKTLLRGLLRNGGC